MTQFHVFNQNYCLGKDFIGKDKLTFLQDQVVLPAKVIAGTTSLLDGLGLRNLEMEMLFKTQNYFITCQN